MINLKSFVSKFFLVITILTLTSSLKSAECVDQKLQSEFATLSIRIKPNIIAFTDVYNFEVNKLKLKVYWQKEEVENKALNGKVKLVKDDEEIGYLSYIKNFCGLGFCHISKLVINSEFRKSGLGSFFIKHVCQKLVEQGEKEIELYASPFELHKESEAYKQQLIKLILFYKKNGFYQGDDSQPTIMTYKVGVQDKKTNN